MTKEVNDKFKEQEEGCQSEDNHIEAHRSLNEEASWLTTEVKRVRCGGC